MLWHCQSWCIASTKFWWMAFRHFHPEHFLHSCYLCRFEPIEDIILHFVWLQNFCPIPQPTFSGPKYKMVMLFRVPMSGLFFRLHWSVRVYLQSWNSQLEVRMPFEEMNWKRMLLCLSWGLYTHSMNQPGT